MLTKITSDLWLRLNEVKRVTKSNSIYTITMEDESWHKIPEPELVLDFESVIVKNPFSYHPSRASNKEETTNE
jgi:hypothetical protein